MMNTTDIHRERDAQRKTIRDQLEAGVELAGGEVSDEALLSIAISLRRLADFSGVFFGYLTGLDSRNSLMREPGAVLAAAARLAVAIPRETWEEAIRKAKE